MELTSETKLERRLKSKLKNLLLKDHFREMGGDPEQFADWSRAVDRHFEIDGVGDLVAVGGKPAKSAIAELRQTSNLIDSPFQKQQKQSGGETGSDGVTYYHHDQLNEIIKADPIGAPQKIREGKIKFRS
ncbi:hypothetical protein L3556_07295 [Candidatus Synechococcus calcipolaris G9]|uniref:Uncharacterized protein n=1 Tax=Candidatus Synechococcus calcipolaris G9 TaxID=1497997 RepID=A0ABT6EY53_9SYNE|nr:hypothetical protein [Candidatus Synechococcus calcipolaris]MDG2990736.1 hypothetical protein [Candidatus Synechococcus calcipolaris G9]